MDKSKIDITNITKLIKEKDQVLVLSILVIAIILVAYFYFFLKPEIGALQKVLPKVRALNKNIKEVDKLIGNIDSFKTKIADLKEKVDQYEARLPTKKEISSILNHLSALASQEHIKITGIKELETIKGEMQEGEQAYSGVPIEIDMKSGYHRLGKFINEIENSDRLMKIDDLEIKSTSENLTEHNVKLIVSSFVLVKE